MICIAALLAFVLRFCYLVAFEDQQGEINYSFVFWDFLASYSYTVWYLILISLTVFSLNGFYSYGRRYRSRYQALIVAQAVSLSFLLVGFLSYFLNGMLKFSFPPSILVTSWTLSLVFLVTARLWSNFWSRLNHTEQRKYSHRSPLTPEESRILVIGGGGYIGSELLPRLLNMGYQVRLLDLLLYSTDPIKDVLGHPRLEIMEADFRQVDKVVEAMRNVDTVIHLGAIVGDPACDLDEELTIEVNVMATRVIAEVAKGIGVKRFIFTSTCSVYGIGDQIETLDECSKLNPVSLYARSKIASEKVLMSMSCSDFAPVILRFGTIFGLSGRPRFDLVVNLLSAKAVLDGLITVINGNHSRAFLFVGDAAESLTQALTAPLDMIRNQIFNVGSDSQNFTINEIAEMIQQKVPTARIVDMGGDTDRRDYRVSFRKIRNIIGFEPQVTVKQGIQQVLDSINKGEITDYTDIRYSNVKFLSEETNSKLIQRENGWAHELVNDIIPNG